MITLGIDTSCDDTSIAIARDTHVLSNVISSQDALHREWGGVVPMVAKRAHQEHFDRVLEQALKRAHLTPVEIDQVAVTAGPGLAPALEVGVERGLQLAHQWNVPLRPVFHMEAHLLAVFAQSKSGQSGNTLTKDLFPALGVLVSGGHTELIRVNAIGEYKLIGATVDDAFGEAFDKVARLIGLGYPGGALLAQLASAGNPSAYDLPIAMRQSGDLNVSYSGIKTACVRLHRELTQEGQHSLTKQQMADFAASFQHAAVKTLMYKINAALTDINPASIWLGGGAAANIQLRKELRHTANENKIPFLTPYSNKLCRDNGAMIAIAATLHPSQSHLTLDRDPRLNWSSCQKFFA